MHFGAMGRGICMGWVCWLAVMWGAHIAMAGDLALQYVRRIVFLDKELDVYTTATGLEHGSSTFI